MAKVINHTFEGVQLFPPTGDLAGKLDELKMDFNVLNEPLFYTDPEADVPAILGEILKLAGKANEEEAKKVLAKLMATRMRSDFNRQILHGKSYEQMGVVGLGYTTQPYPEAFALAETLIKSGASIVGGECLNRGEKAILLMESDGVFSIAPGDDIVNRYALLSGHDGQSKIEVRMTPWRKLTGTAITFDATRPLSFKHTKKVSDRIKRARAINKSVLKNWGEFTAGVQKMVAYPLSREQALEFINLVLPTGDNSEASTKLENIRQHVYTIYTETGIGTRLPQCQGTVFGLVQAFCEWADIYKTVRKSKNRDEKAAQLDARLISDGAKKKQKAWAFANYLVNNNKMKKAAR